MSSSSIYGVSVSGQSRYMSSCLVDGESKYKLKIFLKLRWGNFASMSKYRFRDCESASKVVVGVYASYACFNDQGSHFKTI